MVNSGKVAAVSSLYLPATFFTGQQWAGRQLVNSGKVAAVSSLYLPATFFTGQQWAGRQLVSSGKVAATMQSVPTCYILNGSAMGWPAVGK